MVKFAEIFLVLLGKDPAYGANLSSWSRGTRRHENFKYVTKVHNANENDREKQAEEGGRSKKELRTDRNRCYTRSLLRELVIFTKQNNGNAKVPSACKLPGSHVASSGASASGDIASMQEARQNRDRLDNSRIESGGYRESRLVKMSRPSPR